jgi:hypothetical protein
MKITLGKVGSEAFMVAFSRLCAVAGLRASDMLGLSRSLEVLNNEANRHHDLRVKLMEEAGAQTDGQNYVLDKTAPGFAKCEEQFAALADEEVVLPMKRKVLLSGNVAPLTAFDLQQLEELIEVTD